MNKSIVSSFDVDHRTLATGVVSALDISHKRRSGRLLVGSQIPCAHGACSARVGRGAYDRTPYGLLPQTRSRHRQPHRIVLPYGMQDRLLPLDDERRRAAADTRCSGQGLCRCLSAALGRGYSGTQRGSVRQPRSLCDRDDQQRHGRVSSLSLYARGGRRGRNR